MGGKTMRLRRNGTCVVCAVDLPSGMAAVWYADEKVVRCEPCAASLVASNHPALSDTPQAEGPPSTPSDSVAGGSAQREYERRSAKESTRKQERIEEDAAWRRTLKEERPVLGRLVTALTPKPQIGPEAQPTKAWKIGAEGERRVAEVLAGVEGVEVLHDRLIPMKAANIDHLAVSSSGVFVIDAKKYSGKVETRDVGGMFREDLRLYVNNRNQTKLVDGVLGQVSVVRAVLNEAFPHVQVRGVLCFVNAEWGIVMRPRHVRGVTALWPTKLPELLSVPGPHAEAITEIAAHLRECLRAGRAT